MNVRLNCILALFLLSPAHLAAQPPLSHRLGVNANTPVVTIETREAGKDLIQLPSLQYDLSIEPQCVADFSPSVLSLSIADTRRSFNADSIPESIELTVEFAVPAAQIGPLTVEEFCVVAEESPADDVGIHTPEQLNIPTILSLQASLLCANDTESQIVYAAKSLDVTLQCAPAVPLAPTATD